MVPRFLGSLFHLFAEDPATTSSGFDVMPGLLLLLSA